MEITYERILEKKDITKENWEIALEVNRMGDKILSMRIAKLLEEQSFSFSPISLKGIHRYLFEGIFPEEEIQSLDILSSYFKKEREINYSELSSEEQIDNLSKFISSVWSVHTFVEGNTIAVATFGVKYLSYLGFHVNKELVKQVIRIEELEKKRP